MSGGHFNYTQFYLQDIKDEIEREIPKEENQAIKKKFQEALYYLEKAYIYAHRIDWYLSGDDGEESFLERLENELTQLNKKYKDVIENL